MQNIDTYIKLIAVIYNNSTLEEPKDINKLVNDVLTVIKPPKKGLFGGVASIEDRLVDTINELLVMDYPISEDILKDSISINLRDDEVLCNLTIKTVFRTYDTDKKRRRYIYDLIRLLNQRKNEYVFKNSVNKVSIRMNMDGTIPLGDIANELKNIIKKVEDNDNGSDLPKGFKEPIDISNTEQTADVISDDVSLDARNRFQTGWQSVNKMLCGGIIRGENVMLLLKENDYKSSLGRSLIIQIAMYNKPHNVNPDKKPLLVIITLEDSELEVLTFIYKYLYSDLNGCLPTGKAKDKKYLAEYMKTHMTVNGFHIQIIKGTALDSKFEDIEAVVEMLEKQGFELHVLLLDYLAELSVADIEGYNSATKYKKLWSNFKKLGQNKNFTTISPHQASAEINDLLKDRSIRGVDVVKHMYKKNYIQHSKAINQVTDLTILGYIAKYEGKSVLTLMRDRRRYAEIIDDKDKYVVLPFPNKLAIPSDLNKKDISIDVDSDYDDE